MSLVITVNVCLSVYSIYFVNGINRMITPSATNSDDSNGMVNCTWCLVVFVVCHTFSIRSQGLYLPQQQKEPGRYTKTAHVRDTPFYNYLIIF